MVLLENRPLYIFDLDGTLADIQHRRHHVENGSKKWDVFFKECVNDKPKKSVIDTMLCLALFSDIYIFSGRSDEVKEQTIEWLCKHTHFMRSQLEGDKSILKMRQAGDYTPDDQLKKQWYENLSDSDKSRLCAVFDDRKKVVKVWRSMGVSCFQVAEGDF